VILAPGAAIAAALALVAAGAPNGAGRERPLASLSASPTRIALTGSSRASVTLTNYGATRAQVTASRGSFTLDLRGRPAIGRPGARSAQTWLTFRPSSVSIAPGGKAELEVAARVPARARPGDHHALLLLATRPSRVGGVGVRMRLGVRVAVRAPGKVVRRVAVRGLRVRRSGPVRSLDVTLENLGDLIETRGVDVVLSARGRVDRVHAETREVLPRTRAILTARYAGQLRGRVTARVEVDGVGRRSFRRRL
jgi:hypothetical protein